jgi:hypothetical protein
MVASTCPHRPLNRRVALHGEHVLREIWIGAQSGHSDGYRERLLMAGITLRQKWGDAVLDVELQERSATKLAKEHPAWKSPRGDSDRRAAAEMRSMTQYVLPAGPLYESRTGLMQK